MTHAPDGSTVPWRFRAPDKALTILAILTLSRVCVSFQFQSITPTASHLRETLPLTSAGFGMLLGLYMAPGAAMAIVTPMLARKFGYIVSLLGALTVMGLGQFGLIYAETLPFALLSRLLAGCGGCLIYVLTIDLAAKLCDAGRMPGRMGAVAASWPFGNAFALVLLGVLVSMDMPGIALLIPIGLVVAAGAFVLSGLPHTRTWQATSTSLNEWRQALSSSLRPGLTFALYNVGFILITSFSPDLLVNQGFSDLSAANIASLPMWIFVFSVPLGGWLAGRSVLSGRALVALGCLGPAFCLIASYFSHEKTLWYVLMGVLGGLPTGPMLARAGSAVPRLFYSSLFFIFFIALLIFPPIVGAAIEASGDIRTVLAFCIALLVIPFFLFAPAINPGGRSHV